MEAKNDISMIKFIWRFSYAHASAFMIAGIFAMMFMNYEYLFLTEPLSFMRPTSDPIIPLGATLQLLRGIIYGLVLYPLRKAFFEEDKGYLKLGLVFLGLTVLGTFGPAPGSFDGYIFTNFPLAINLLGYPEALIWIISLVGILKISNKYEHKRIVKIMPFVFVGLIIFVGVSGYLYAISGTGLLSGY